MSTFFSWPLVWKYLPRLIMALPVTLMIVFVATVVGLILGSLLAFVRVERIVVLRQIAIVFVSFIRGTPILVQLYIVYYGVPAVLQATLGLDISSWNKIIFLYIAYGLNTAAFQSETIRAAIESIPKNQTDACIACGLTKPQMYMSVILPQMVRVAMPAFGTTTISLLQDTSLAFTIGVIDVVGKAKSIGVYTYHMMEAYIGAALIFIILSFILERIFASIEKRMSFTTKVPSVSIRTRLPQLLRFRTPATES